MRSALSPPLEGAEEGREGERRGYQTIMKTLQTAWMLATLLLMPLAFAACGGSDEPNEPEPSVDDVTGLTVLTETEDGLYRSDVLVFRITDKSKHEVEVVNPVSPETCRGAEIPHAVNIDGERYAVTAIADKAFSFYEKKSNTYSENNVLEFLTIPHSVKRIGKNVCLNCRALKTIFIPKEVTDMDNAFLCCGLTEIVVQEGNPVFDSRKNCNAVIRTKDDCLLVGCQNTVIPDGVKTIGERAFHKCNGLTEIVIPASVATIKYWAFLSCSNLTKITSLNPTPPTVKEDAFSYVNKACTVYVPVGSRNAYINAWPFEYGAVKEIGSEAVDKVVTIDGLKYRVTSATEAELVGPEDLNKAVNVVVADEIQVDGYTFKVTAIGDRAFTLLDETQEQIVDNEILRSVKFPKSLVRVGFQAFSACVNLTQIVLPEGVTTIDMMAFIDCRRLSKVTFPSTLLDIGQHAFYFCKALTEITLPGQLKDIRKQAFDANGSLQKITSLNPTPPTLEYGVFGSVPRSCTIYVPKGCKSKYVEAWGDKTNFVYDDYVEM